MIDEEDSNQPCDELTPFEEVLKEVFPDVSLKGTLTERSRLEAMYHAGIALMFKKINGAEHYGTQAIQKGKPMYYESLDRYRALCRDLNDGIPQHIDKFGDVLEDKSEEGLTITSYVV